MQTRTVLPPSPTLPHLLICQLTRMTVLSASNHCSTEKDKSRPYSVWYDHTKLGLPRSEDALIATKGCVVTGMPQYVVALAPDQLQALFSQGAHQGPQPRPFPLQTHIQTSTATPQSNSTAEVSTPQPISTVEQARRLHCPHNPCNGKRASYSYCSCPIM